MVVNTVKFEAVSKELGVGASDNYLVAVLE